MMWDSLSSLDNSWKGLEYTANLGDNYKTPDEWHQVLLDIGKEYGGPDMHRRNMMRYVVDGQYKLVRYFSPLEYGNPQTVEELRELGDLGLYDLQNDPGELDNLADPAHPRHDPDVMERMTRKLHALVRDEVGPDERPFDIAMFGEPYDPLPEERQA
ncbi:MAG: hypothetical protein Q4C67_04875 [Deinococcus sp.]|nr:hypothetical protein [Deinococcus sp.]